MAASSQIKWRRKALVILGVLLLLSSVVITGLDIFQSSEKDADIGSDGLDQQGSMQADLGEENRPVRERKKGVWSGRIAAGQVSEGGINSSWGFVIVENLNGNPEPGDEAYIARLGPAGGLLRVEVVENGRAVMDFHTLDPSQLKDGDRIETMPPAAKLNQLE